MIVLLAADHDDARRHRANAPDGEQVVWVIESREVRADIIEPGARIHRSDRWVYDQRIVGALAALHTRIGLVDPTGLLGPVQHSPGAKSRKPPGSPSVGSRVTPTVKKQRSNFDPNFGSVL